MKPFRYKLAKFLWGVVLGLIGAILVFTLTRCTTAEKPCKWYCPKGSSVPDCDWVCPEDERYIEVEWDVGP